jgi:hypothetical protein
MEVHLEQQTSFSSMSCHEGRGEGQGRAGAASSAGYLDDGGVCGVICFSGILLSMEFSISAESSSPSFALIADRNNNLLRKIIMTTADAGCGASFEILSSSFDPQRSPLLPPSLLSYPPLLPFADQGSSSRFFNLGVSSVDPSLLLSDLFLLLLCL